MYMLYIIYPCIHHHSMSSLVSDAFCCVRSMISCVRSSHDLCARACTRTELRGNSKTKEGYSAGHPATDIFFRLELNPPRGHPATDIFFRLELNPPRGHPATDIFFWLELNPPRGHPAPDIFFRLELNPPRGHPATDIFFRLELNPPRGHPATDQRNYIIIN